MKTKSYVLLLPALLSALLILCFCERETPPVIDPDREALLTLTVSPTSPKTKSINALNVGEQESIHRLDIFVFNDDEDKTLDVHHVVENYNKTNPIQLKVSKGSKIIYAVANVHALNNQTQPDWSGFTYMEWFTIQTISLFNERLDDFSMIGSESGSFTKSEAVTIEMSRFVAKVVLESVSTDFEGTAYEGTNLLNVRAFLYNVVNKKTLSNYNPVNSYPADGRTASGYMSIPNGLCDTLGTLTADVPHTTKHYFYAYENNTEYEGNMTRLVIEAQFQGGKTYYYPINIKGMTANNTYSYNVVIRRPGSDDPDTPITFEDATISIDIVNWEPNGPDEVVF